MVVVAVLLLPGLGLLLFTMTYLEDRLLRDPGPPRHARRGHLRLLPGGRGHHSRPRPEPAGAHASERDAA
ncbi:hypothetical protein [Streptomyces sp. BK208]|uniref:hypothetical protein n=1 Tax=Streptomyces sp. BK208 TaxID=2512150 RepID=UPI001414FB1F|nr:hypothetical protein [Streptomyces sp. BK208]